MHVPQYFYKIQKNQNAFMLIYFAAPLFSEAERLFNHHLTEKLESISYQVFLPQRDGVKSDKSPYNQITKEERRLLMFQLDTKKNYGS